MALKVASIVQKKLDEVCQKGNKKVHFVLDGNFDKDFESLLDVWVQHLNANIGTLIYPLGSKDPKKQKEPDKKVISLAQLMTL